MHNEGVLEKVYVSNRFRRRRRTSQRKHPRLTAMLSNVESDASDHY